MADGRPKRHLASVNRGGTSTPSGTPETQFRGNQIRGKIVGTSQPRNDRKEAARHRMVTGRGRFERHYEVKGGPEISGVDLHRRRTAGGVDPRVGNHPATTSDDGEERRSKTGASCAPPRAGGPRASGRETRGRSAASVRRPRASLSLTWPTDAVAQPSRWRHQPATGRAYRDRGDGHRPAAYRDARRTIADITGGVA